MSILLIFISSLGLLSIVACLLMAAGYGIVLILLVGTIRDVRQEISRNAIRRTLRLMVADQFLSAAIALALTTLMWTVPAFDRFAPLLRGENAQDQTLIYSVALLLGLFAALWLAVGCLLYGLQQSLTSRGSVQKELVWEPWLSILFVLGFALQAPTACFFLLICVPYLWQVRRIATLGRQSDFMWTLALANSRGLPLGREIKSLSEGLWGRQRFNLELLSESLDAGQSISTSLERQPKLVPQLNVMQIRLGEETGTLCQVLSEYGAGQFERQTKEVNVASLHHSVMILTLPLIFLPVIVGYLSYSVAWKFKNLFSQFQVDLPLHTEIMFSVLDRGLWGTVLIGVICFSLVAIAVAILVWDRDRNWPFLLWLAPRSNAPPILRSLAILVREQRPLTMGLQAMKNSQTRTGARKQLSRVLKQIEFGLDAWEALAKVQLISRHDLLLFKAAERVRNLPWALNQVAKMIERRNENRLRITLELAFPIATISIGFVFLAFAAAIMLPLATSLEQLAKSR